MIDLIWALKYQNEDYLLTQGDHVNISIVHKPNTYPI